MLTLFTFSNLRLFREPQSIKSDRREDFVLNIHMTEAKFIYNHKL